MPDRICELRNLILKAKQAYYYGGNAIMTDAQYDALEEELGALSPGDPVLAIVGAPVPPDSLLTKAEHRIHMGSQSKVNHVPEFETWYEKHAQGDAILAALKADGASAAAYYEQGALTQVISRGDGTIGEDISANAVRFRGLPAFVGDKNAPFTGAVRFEVILTVEQWARIDPSMSTNPRNLGSGIMGRKNGHQADMLAVYVFDLTEEHDGNVVDFITESAKTKRIMELGFEVMPHRVCQSAAEVIEYYRDIEATRAALPFWIDGVVLKINSLARQAELGVVSNRPKGQIAWKFESVGAETVLENYVLSGGHTGAIVPTAQLRPVQIGGTTVSSALLNNWEEIARLNVAVGDTVYVIKANDIIPKVIEVRQRPSDRQPIPEPERCPFCDGPTHRRVNTDGEGGAVTICGNEDCPVKASGKIKRWVKGLDILGVGGSVLEALIEQLGVQNAADLYTLRERREELAEMIINQDKGIRLGSKRADSIIEAVERKRHLSLLDFLGALGIDKLGRRRAEMIVQAVSPRLNTLASWRQGKLRDPALAEAAGVPNLGDVIQDAIDQAKDVIEAMLAHGVTVAEVAEATAAAAAPAPGGTVCITGKLPSGKKKNAYKEPLQDAGFELVDSVAKGLTYLVLADPNSTSSKAQKARKLGVGLLSEEGLVALIEQNSAQLELGL